LRQKDFEMMKYRLLLMAAVMTAAPAQAQMFWQAPDFSGAPITMGETGVGQFLPGANPAEMQANTTWQMRAALNVMALQCQFEGTLLAANAYNGVLVNHRDELSKTYATLVAYFNRTNKLPKAARNAMETYGTKTYLGFSTVRAQIGFCQTASNVAKSAIFAPHGSFHIVATERLREIRNSLVPAGEQQFRFRKRYLAQPLPDLSDRCWDRRGNFNTRKCAYIETLA
jgi:hypothetical protein